MCLPQARATVAHVLHVAPGSVSARVTTSSAATPECALGGPRSVSIALTVDSAPQAYFRLERAVVEQGQQFGTVRTAAPPQHVPGIGLDADWFPDARELMSTDGRRLISVTAVWPAAGGRGERLLAQALIRDYLR